MVTTLFVLLTLLSECINFQLGPDFLGPSFLQVFVQAAIIKN